MSSIMELIGPELSKLSALEFEHLPYLTLFTLASANIDQSVPNLATIYMPIRSRMTSITGQIESEHSELLPLIIKSQMSSIMDLIGPELFELSALELENLPYLTLFTLQHLQILTNQYQTWPQLITGKIELEHQELFALEFGKIAENDFVYTLSSTNIDQSALNVVKMYVIIRSRLCPIMDLIGPELFELSALELENLPYLTLLHSSICKY